MKKLNLIILYCSILLLTAFNANNHWYSYESKAYGFKIQFPEKPMFSNEDVGTDLGKLKLNYIIYDPSLNNKKDENLTYMVNYIEYPITKVNSDNPQQLISIYKNSIGASIKNVKGKLIDEKIVTLQGYTGRDIVIDVPNDNYRVNMRMLLVKNKMYMIQVFSKKENSLKNESLNKFFKSFSLIW